ncbi:hypothetical protein BU17DRAFT_79862 [Hysterangium stoloniferum]|nr:hypothetical protein BU17DRAFT_79862 [Hysterangium stoloniferum]
MGDIAADKAELIGFFVETLLYGIFVSVFHQSLRIVLGKRSGSDHSRLLLLTSIAIFLAATGHLIVRLLRALEAFVDHKNRSGGAVTYYANLHTALEVCQASFQTVMCILGDAMAVYRVFVVYNRSPIAIFIPFLCLLGNIVTTVGTIVVIGQSSSSEATPFYFHKLEMWLPAFLSFTFCTSIICSGLIATRIWYITERITEFSETKGRGKMRSVQRIFIESAAMYAVAMLIYLSTYLAKTNYSIIAGDTISPIIGIAFSLITIRVNDTFYSAPTTFTLATQSGPLAFRATGQSNNRSALSGVHSVEQSDIQMKTMPLSINVHHSTEHGSDQGSEQKTRTFDQLS